MIKRSRTTKLKTVETVLAKILIEASTEEKEKDWYRWLEKSRNLVSSALQKGA